MPTGNIGLRPIEEEDLAFLCRVYSSTRLTEMAVTEWSDCQLRDFLQMQFGLQHAQYTRNYPDASFDIVLIDGLPAGRLYVDRTKGDIRIIDISLLPKFRGRGIGGRILRELVEEADTKGLGLSLHVEMNSPVRDFYKRLGFEEIVPQGIYLYMARPAADSTKRP